jgi:hypothetical protein
VTVPIISPIALPAAALSPDFCAASMRLPASSIFRAISAMLDESMRTSPDGVEIVTSASRLVPARPAPWNTPDGSSCETTPKTITIRTMPQTITTAV